MPIIIPKQLQNPYFRFVKLGLWNSWKNQKTKTFKTFDPKEYEVLKQDKVWKPQGKAPQELGWQKTNNYTYDDISLLEHLNNLGIIGGYGSLCILDIDNRELAEELLNKFETFTVKTGSQGYHFYFKSPHKTNHVFKDKNGEWRADRYQAVIPPSRHPNGNYYEVLKDLPIKELSEKETIEIISPYLREENESLSISPLDNEPMEVAPLDRSREEMKAVCSFIMRGFNQLQVYEQMNQFVKWKDGTPQYRDLTYNKALKWCLDTRLKSNPLEHLESNTIKIDVESENWTQALYTDRDLENYQMPSQDYIVIDMIPREQVGILVGYSGERKTFVMLHTAICIASGKPVFGIMDVPKKAKVLIIDEENGKPEIAKRIKSLKAGMNITDPLEIAYLSYFNSKLDQPSKQKKILEFIEQYKPEVIFVDCLQRVLSIDIDKENQLLSEFFTSFIRPTVTKHKCSWVFVHHYRKRDSKSKYVNPLDEIRGASELRNYIRFAWGIQRPGKVVNGNDTDKILIKQLKMSNAPASDDRVISFTNQQDGSLTVKFEGFAEDVLNTEQLCAEAIKQWLIDENKITFISSEVIDAEPGGFKKTTINSALKILINTKILKKLKKGSYELIGQILDEKPQEVST